MADAAAVQAMEALQSCRCCLRRPPDKGLKTLYENVGKTENYWDMLKECFNIHLNVGNDECGICEVCVARLRDATEFKMQVQQSQVELKALLEKALQEKDKKPSVIKVELVEEDPNVEEVMIQDDDPVKSEMGDGDIVSSVLSGGEISYTEVGQSDELNTESFECPECQKSFDLEESLTRHMFAVHTKSPLSAKKKINICNFCCRCFKIKTHLTKHMTIHKEHNDTKDPWCDICEKILSSKSNLEAHKLIHTREKPYSCEVCSKLFAHKHNMRSHMKYHKGQQFSSGICARNFTEQSHLTNHELVHTDKRTYCEVCKKPFKKITHLKMHMLVHTGEKPHSCEICKKKFRQRSHLNTHLNTHMENRQYKFSCDVCQKQFAQKSHLTSHRRLHTG